MDEACHCIARANKIIPVALGRDLKFFDVLFTLRDRFLAVEVNICVVEVMKIASEVMWVKVGEIYVNLSTCHRDAITKVVSVENERALIQTNYETCLQENDLLCELCESVMLSVLRKT